MEVKTIDDLDVIVEKLLDDEYLLKRGETYGFDSVITRDEYYGRV